MTWKIPKVTAGDKVELLVDTELFGGLVLEKGRVLTVKDVGRRYGLPFVWVPELHSERQLQPRTYQKYG